MIKHALELFCRLLRFTVGGLMAALAVPVGLQVISRYTNFIPPYLWTEELATFIFVWIVMLGSMVAIWEGTHFDVAVTPDATNPLSILFQRGFVLVCLILFALMFVYFGIEFAEVGAIQRSVMMQVSLLWTYITVPVAGAIWLILAGYRLYELIAAYFTQTLTPEGPAHVS